MREVISCKLAVDPNFKGPPDEIRNHIIGWWVTEKITKDELPKEKDEKQIATFR